MSVFQERVNNPEKLTRIISIRVSEIEYQDLQRFSRASGARSIAEIARHSIQQTLLKCATDSSHSVAIYMYLLHQTVDRLVSEVGDCAEMLTEVTRSRTSVRQRRKNMTVPNSVALAKTASSPTPGLTGSLLT